MKDAIAEIGINEKGQLYVKPSKKAFPLMYREAMEVHWNSEQSYLYGPKPREWSYLEWFQQIFKAALEQGCELRVSSQTSWVNVPGELQQQIVGEQSGKNT